MRLGAITTLGVTLLAGAALAAPAQADTSGGAQAPDGSTGTQQSSPPASSQPSSSPQPATQPGQDSTAGTGGSAYGDYTILPELTVPGIKAKIVHNLAEAPALAPPAVQQAIWAANHIVGKPYIYGGGHSAFAASGYDCSGTVSYALHGGMLLASPLDSTEFESWGLSGRGQWITIFANAGHAYMDVAGVRLDTSSADDPTGRQGPQWRRLRHSNHGYIVRHPLGL